jgi:hypothetical protein
MSLTQKKLIKTKTFNKPFFEHKFNKRWSTSVYQKNQDRIRHYEHFRICWAKAVQDENAKSKLVPCDVYKRNDHGQWFLHKKGGIERKKGWITPAHYVLYNLIVNRPLNIGFAPITSKTKLDSVSTPWQHFNEAIAELEQLVELAQKYTKEPIQNKLQYNELSRVMDFLKPLRDSITIMDLTYIDTSFLKTVRVFISKKF